jgi:hypothetical protein
MYKRSAKGIFRIILSLLAAVTVGLAQEELNFTGNDNPLYKIIRSQRVNSEGHRVSEITIQKDAARIHLAEGDLWFFTPVEGKILGAVFIGQGNIRIDPAAESEKKFLAKLTEGAPFSENFEKLTLFFSDDPFRPFSEQLRRPSASAPDKARKSFQETRDLFRKGRKYNKPNRISYFFPWNIDARLLFDILNQPRDETFFLASGDGKLYGDFVYIEDPLGIPGHEPEEVVLLNLSQKNLGSWYSAHFTGHYRNGRPLDPHPLRLIEVERYRIEARLDGRALQAWAVMFFTPLQDRIKMIPLDFDGSLRIAKIMDKAGESVSFIQEKDGEDADLSVSFPTPLEKGKSYALHFFYAGDKSIVDRGNGNFSLLDRSTWYPNPGIGSYNAVFDLEFDIPDKTRIVATGRKVRETQKKDRLISAWKSEVPLKVAGFSYGIFETEESVEKSSGYRIETYANEKLPNELAEIQHYASNLKGASELAMLGSLNTIQMMKLVHAEAEVAVNTYTDCFGSLPYGRIAITQQPFYDFGQAWPTLIFMPLTAFLPEIQKEIMGVNRAFYARTFFKLVCAHEVAHQWWGHWVGWSNYRDQWLSEALAVWSSSLFAQRVYGVNFMNDFWDEMKERLTHKNSRRVRPIEMGGPEMGYRLDTGKTGESSYGVIYGKGGYILHMLRMLMWKPEEGDTRFLAMLKDLVTDYANGFLTTEDFKAHVEKHMTPDMDLRRNSKMDWFFDQWVYGTQLPRYSLEYEVTKGKDGKYQAELEVRQSQVSDDFVMLVPVYGQFGKNTVRICQVRLEGNAVSIPVTIPLREKPKKLMLCANHDVLCEVK